MESLAVLRHATAHLALEKRVNFVLDDLYEDGEELSPGNGSSHPSSVEGEQLLGAGFGSEEADNVPMEDPTLVYLILAYLPLPDLVKSVCVCKTWQLMAKSPCFWGNICMPPVPVHAQIDGDTAYERTSAYWKESERRRALERRSKTFNAKLDYKKLKKMVKRAAGRLRSLELNDCDNLNVKGILHVLGGNVSHLRKISLVRCHGIFGKDVVHLARSLLAAGAPLKWVSIDGCQQVTPTVVRKLRELLGINDTPSNVCSSIPSQERPYLDVDICPWWSRNHCAALHRCSGDHSGPEVSERAYGCKRCLKQCVMCLVFYCDMHSNCNFGYGRGCCDCFVCETCFHQDSPNCCSCGEAHCPKHGGWCQTCHQKFCEMCWLSACGCILCPSCSGPSLKCSYCDNRMCEEHKKACSGCGDWFCRTHAWHGNHEACGCYTCASCYDLASFCSDCGGRVCFGHECVCSACLDIFCTSCFVEHQHECGF